MAGPSKVIPMPAMFESDLLKLILKDSDLTLLEYELSVMALEIGLAGKTGH